VGKESHQVRVPVFFSGEVCALELNIRRGSGLPWATARTGRDAAGRGVLGSLTGGADCFLERRRGVAGNVPGDGGLRPSTDASICCKLEPTEGIRGCAGAKGRG
jgi:hypothetical protein